jgi:ribonuclease P/MRP protein subunit RPP1
MVSGSARVRLLACLRREVQLAKAFNVPIILSSGAPNPRLLRKPREMAALASLFSLGEMEALDAVSTNPAGIVKRNREKLSPEFVAPGIRLIKEGKDC